MALTALMAYGLNGSNGFSGADDNYGAYDSSCSNALMGSDGASNSYRSCGSNGSYTNNGP